MRKSLYKIIVTVLIFILHICCFSTKVMALTYENLTDLGLKSKSAILMEEDTGTIIYEQNSHERLPPASVTKVMTLLLIYEAEESGKIKWDDMVTVSEHAASMGGSQVFLEPFEQQTVRDMTKCISICSANDAAVAMAEHLGGSEQGFVDMMNGRAHELGMEDTNFVNACGLDAEGHVTSAYDIALMSRQLLNNYPQVKEFTTTWMDTITHKTRKGESEFGLTNTNKLIKWYSGATGLKTGSTNNALYCLSGSAERNGLRLVSVVMGGPDSKTRFREVMNMLDYGFANYEIKQGRNAGEKLGEVAVYKGQSEKVDAVAASAVSALVKKGENGELTQKTELMPSVTAPVEKGMKIGEIRYYINEKEVGKSDLISAEAVGKITFSKMLARMLERWF